MQIEQTAAPRPLFGSWLGWSRLTWGVVFVVAGGTFLYSLPTYYRALMTPCTGDNCLSMQPSVAFAQAMATLGWPLQWFAAWNVVIVTTLALAYGAFAVLLVWRRSTDRSVWLFSVILLLIGAFLTAAVDTLVLVHPFWFYFINLMHSLLWMSLVLLFYIFPDGRFVPAWSWVGMVPLVILRASLFLPASFPLAKENWPGFVEPILVIIIFGTSIFAQVYRYRAVSTPLQRQQTKWIVFGLVLMAVALLLFSLGLEGDVESSAAPITQVLLSLTLPFIWLLVFLTLPATVTIAILRYRLWDIDLLIRRTLIYSVLTTILAVIYFSSVVVLQTLFEGLTGQGQNTFVTVLSTIAIAALFAPLRQGVQAWIDRRFYRRKYDAEQVLLAFGDLVRDETDLDRLSAQLMRVVGDTIQPTQVLLWVHKPPAGPND
jgi:hypothetical protein